MNRIDVKALGAGKYQVTVEEADDQTQHTVDVPAADLARLTGGKHGAEELLKKSFEFLLEREPKESILGRFDIMTIARYFPEYEREIRARLG